MKKFLSYVSYVVRHKYYVLLAGLKIGAPIHLLLLHDVSKFLPSEFLAYVNYFYGKEENCSRKEFKRKLDFDKAWLKHQNRNKHHWQYWVLLKDDGSIIPMIIPHKYILEMVADWAGAGRAIAGKWEVKKWYVKNKDKIVLHEVSRLVVEELLNEFFEKD